MDADPGNVYMVCVLTQSVILDEIRPVGKRSRWRCTSLRKSKITSLPYDKRLHIGTSPQLSDAPPSSLSLTSNILTTIAGGGGMGEALAGTRSGNHSFLHYSLISSGHWLILIEQVTVRMDPCFISKRRHHRYTNDGLTNCAGPSAYQPALALYFQDLQ